MPARRGFTIVECLVILALVSAMISFGPPSCMKSKRSAREAVCQSNLHQFGIATSNYATDFQDSFASLSARKGVKIDGADEAFNAAKDDLEAVANQAVWIIRQRADREDIRPITGWLPNPSYTHLVLIDYLQQRLPELMAVCPEDSARMALFPKGKRNKNGEAADPIIPPAADNAAKRWMYSSSYQFVPATYSLDQTRGTPKGTVPTISQGATDDEYLVPKTSPFARRRLSEVNFPSGKVMMMDTHDRHKAKSPLFYADPAAIQPLSMMDSSVRMIETSKMNKGFRPNEPASKEPTTFTYAPGGVGGAGGGKEWYPAPIHAGGDKDQIGYYRWTRGGLQGIDTAGKEVETQGAAAVAEDAFVKVQH